MDRAYSTIRRCRNQGESLALSREGRYRRWMPLIQVLTSSPSPPADARERLLRELSGALASHFGKPGKWVMTCILPELAMTFGGTPAPTCFAAVKNGAR